MGPIRGLRQWVEHVIMMIFQLLHRAYYILNVRHITYVLDLFV